MLTTSPDSRLVTPLLGGLIATSWLLLWTLGASPYGRYLDHHSVTPVDTDRLVVVVAFLLGWLLMVVAMMLPSSLPLVALFRVIVRRRPHRGRLLGLLLVGYLSVWTLFGLVVHAADGELHALAAAQPWVEAHAGLIGASTLLVAGVYQLTRLKMLCLSQCRSPRSFVVTRWHGSRPNAEAFRLGVEHGLFCVGCCWTLMLLMFGVGVGSFGWMFGLGALMGAERNLRWARGVTRPLGLALIAAAFVAFTRS